MENNETINVSEELKGNNSLLFQLYDINVEDNIFTIEISIETKDKIEYITFKGYNKISFSRVLYKNSFNLKQLIEKSKAFKVCDNLEEVFEIIQRKFKDKEITVLLNDNLNINMEFILPNKKIDKVIFSLLKGKFKESEIVEKLYESLAYLQEKNRNLEEQLKNLNLISKKKTKSLIDIIKNKFNKSKFIILRELYATLDHFGLKSEYANEIGNKFQSKVKTIYDAKKDGDTITGFITKVFGKKNLAGFFSYYIYNENEKEYGCYKFGGQLAFLNGKLEFENNYLRFLKNDIFSYGTYSNVNGETNFTFFRDNNAKLFIKIEKNAVYFIAYRDSFFMSHYLIKIVDHFLSQPIIWNYDLKSKEESNIEERIGELLDKYKDLETKIYLKEVKVYQIEEN